MVINMKKMQMFGVNHSVFDQLIHGYFPFKNETAEINGLFHYFEIDQHVSV